MTRKRRHNDEAVYKKNHTGRIFLNGDNSGKTAI